MGLFTTLARWVHNALEFTVAKNCSSDRTDIFLLEKDEKQKEIKAYKKKKLIV